MHFLPGVVDQFVDPFVLEELVNGEVESVVLRPDLVLLVNLEVAIRIDLHHRLDVSRHALVAELECVRQCVALAGRALLSRLRFN